MLALKIAALLACTEPETTIDMRETNAFVYDAEYIAPEKRYLAERQAYYSRPRPDHSREFPPYEQWLREEDERMRKANNALLEFIYKVLGGLFGQGVGTNF